jgi:uncharacterized membrane protein
MAADRGAAISMLAAPASARGRGVVLWRVMVGLTVLGLAVATYLTVTHYAGIVVLCTTKNNSCELVQTSIYSTVAGVPVALLGLIGYVAILASLLAPEREATRLATLGLVIVGFGFSLYLTYREAFSLHEYCEWCLSSAGILTVLFPLAIWRYLSGGSQPPDAPR